MCIYIYIYTYVYIYIYVYMALDLARFYPNGQIAGFRWCSVASQTRFSPSRDPKERTDIQRARLAPNELVLTHADPGGWLRNPLRST